MPVSNGATSTGAAAVIQRPAPAAPAGKSKFQLVLQVTVQPPRIAPGGISTVHIVIQNGGGNAILGVTARYQLRRRLA